MAGAPLLKLGSTGRAVGFLQRRLNVASTSTFDVATASALAAWQSANGLTPDSIFGPASCAVMVRALDRDRDAAAQQAGISRRAIDTLIYVEASAAGFYGDGLPVIRLERHYVWARATAAQRVALPPDLCSPTQGGYAATPYDEWARFEQVASVCGVEVAAASTSWGRGQIMGANYVAAGCSSATALMLKSALNEPAQLGVMATWIAANRGLVNAINREDWDTTARLYNGPANVPVYSQKLKEAYARNAQ